MAARHSTSGFITMLSVLIASALGTVVAVSLLELGIGATKAAAAFGYSRQARSLGSACGEVALQKIADSQGYTGSDTIPLGAGSCTYTVSSDGGQNDTITASGTVGTTVRKIKITIDQIQPKIHVTSWQEVADY
ncbi:hypothetical protein HY065_00795 [Candidatus Berkelbacteria bacterium]|nr:hypothetical protein [Candidatus Berkelbacteria bacterium]